MTDYTGMTTTQERNQLIREVAARDGEIAALKREKSMTQDQWQPIKAAPSKEGDEFLVYDGIGVWKAWVLNGKIRGFEVDGCDLPDGYHPPTRWMPLPAAPKD
jgi:hypothetical protein